MKLILVALGSFLIVFTVLSNVRSAQWWIRIADFPRVQIAVALALVSASAEGAGHQEEPLMVCDRCEEGLIEIDRYGERLTGCIECNRWRSEQRAFIVLFLSRTLRLFES